MLFARQEQTDEFEVDRSDNNGLACVDAVMLSAAMQRKKATICSGDGAMV